MLKTEILGTLRYGLVALSEIAAPFLAYPTGMGYFGITF